MKKDEAIIILGTKAKVNFVPWLTVWNYAHTHVGSYKKRCLGHIVLRIQCFSLVVEIMKRRQVLWYETMWWHHTEKEDKLKKTHPQKNNSGSNSHFICMPTFVQSSPSWNIINSEALRLQESHKVERKTIRDRIIGSSQHPGLPLWARSLLKPAFRSWPMTWLIVASKGTHSWCLSLQYHTPDVDGKLSLQLLPASRNWHASPVALFPTLLSTDFLSKQPTVDTPKLSESFPAPSHFSEPEHPSIIITIPLLQKIQTCSKWTLKWHSVRLYNSLKVVNSKLVIKHPYAILDPFYLIHEGK